MIVTIMRLGGEPVPVELDCDEASVKSIFGVERTGKVLGYNNVSLAQAAKEQYGSLEAMGQIRVNGNDANLGTTVHNDDMVIIVPKVQGG